MSNRKQDSKRKPLRIDVEQLHRISELTLAHYDQFAEAYWDGTRDHDVSQNYTELLDAIEGDPPYSILDLGCGWTCPGFVESCGLGIRVSGLRAFCSPV